MTSLKFQDPANMFLWSYYHPWRPPRPQGKEDRKAVLGDLLTNPGPPSGRGGAMRAEVTRGEVRSHAHEEGQGVDCLLGAGDKFYDLILNYLEGNRFCWWYYIQLYMSLGKEMATHSSTLAWEIPGTEEPCGLQSLGLQRVGHDWATDHIHVLDLRFSKYIFSRGIFKWFQPEGSNKSIIVIKVIPKKISQHTFFPSVGKEISHLW